MKLPIKIDKNRDSRQRNQWLTESHNWDSLLKGRGLEITRLQALLATIITSNSDHTLQQRAIDYYSDLNYLKKQFEYLHATIGIQQTDWLSVNKRALCGQIQVDPYIYLRNQFAAINNEYHPTREDCCRFLSTTI